MGSFLDELDVIAQMNTNFIDTITTFPTFPSALCFDESTEILCLDKNCEEVYVQIRDLVVGTLVKTFKHGYRKVTFIHRGTLVNDVDNFKSCMFLMEKNEKMIKDLILTGGHSILVDPSSLTDEEKEKNASLFNNEENVFDGKQLLLSAASSKFVALTDKDEHKYYHFILENDDNDDARYGVWANGVLCETPSRNFLKSVNIL
jgi:hypothetical protein